MMIRAVKKHNVSASTPSFSRQNKTNPDKSFKQQYANALSGSNEVSNRTTQPVSQAISGKLEPQDIANFYNKLNHQADGSAQLTKEDIRDLKSRYDLYNLTATQRLALLQELNQKNAISYSDSCSSIERHIDIHTLLGAEQSFREMAADEQINPVLRATINWGLQNMNVSASDYAISDLELAISSISGLGTDNIYEEFQAYADYWHTMYTMMLEQYGEQRPAYQDYAASYAHIAKVLKSLM